MDDRRDDWRHGVDQNLASLNAGQRIWEREMVIIRKLLGEFDKLMRGDPDKDTDGMIARLHRYENTVDMLQGVILKDRAGNKKDVISRLEILEEQEHHYDRRLKVSVAIIGLISAISVAVITNWDHIAAYIGVGAKPNKLERIIDKAKHPKNKYRHYVITPEPVDESDSE
jgi:hypothetical protein